MKIAVTATGSTPDCEAEPRFGRAPGFLIYDTDRDAWEHEDNQVNLSAAQGAGIQAAERIARTGATVLLTGHCGPKAHKVLTASGVAIYTGVQGSAEEAVRQYRAGQLTQSSEADVEGHWQ